jgi:hypothetical protein
MTLVAMNPLVRRLAPGVLEVSMTRVQMELLGRFDVDSGDHLHRLDAQGP